MRSEPLKVGSAVSSCVVLWSQTEVQTWVVMKTKRWPLALRGNCGKWSVALHQCRVDQPSLTPSGWLLGAMTFSCQTETHQLSIDLRAVQNRQVSSRTLMLVSLWSGLFDPIPSQVSRARCCLTKFYRRHRVMDRMDQIVCYKAILILDHFRSSQTNWCYYCVGLYCAGEREIVVMLHPLHFPAVG